jgi:glyoxylase-like metal-dependent hydrolase (beta-lactamase superfamily II)
MLQTITAPNPGPFTGPGTNTYVAVSASEAVIIDPGPDIASHADRIRKSVAGCNLVGIVATHHHLDHTEVVGRLAGELNVPTFGHGGGSFEPTIRLREGDSIPFGDHELVVVHTPGHTSDSICLRLGRELFAGDTVKGGSTVVVEDMAAYMATLERLLELEIDEIHPGHGPGALSPEVLDEYLSHRRLREQQVGSAVRHGNSTIGDLIRAVYGDIDPALQPLAARSLQAHLDKLIAEGKVSVDGEWLAG